MSIKDKVKRIGKKIWAGIVAAVLAVGAWLGLNDAESADPVYSVSWTLPTQYTDGSTIPAGDLASTTIAYRVGSGAVQTKVVPVPATSTTIPKNLGTTCANAFVTTVGGIASSATVDVCVTFTGPPRAPTNLTLQ